MNAPQLETPIGRAAGGVGEPVRHEAAHLHVAGEATYIDDIPELRGTVHAAFGLSQRAHARIRSLDLAAVRSSPGVVDVIVADDIPGENNFGPILPDDPILAPGLVQCIGQPIFMVVAETVDQARARGAPRGHRLRGTARADHHRAGAGARSRT